jgi:hypothetical protein
MHFFPMRTNTCLFMCPQVEALRSHAGHGLTCVERLKALRLYDIVCLLKLNKVEHSENVKTASNAWYDRNQLKAVFVHKDCGDPR